MYKNVSLILIITVLTGCVSTKNVPLSDASISNLKGKNAITVRREKPSFGAMTPGKAGLGGLGGAIGGAVAGAAMVSAGDRIIQENNVNDPADYISEVLGKSFAARYSVGITHGTKAVISDEDVSKISEQNKSHRYVFDIRTVNWSFVYFPMSWGKYRVLYSAKLRIIDTKSEEVISEGFCSYVPDKTPDSPSYDQLLANKAKRLKAELRVAADYCIDHFKSNTLKL